jgi:uncharacterized protein (TIGR02147 family)
MHLAHANLFTFEDYRAFLAAFLTAPHKGPKRSLRWLAQRGGFRAHNYLALVLQGKRNLSPASIRKVADALGLDVDESRYFEDLVLMNQASTAKDRARYYERVISHPRRRALRPMERAQLSFFKHWMAPVIYEMVAFPDFRPDADWIAAQFTERPAENEVAEVLRGLREAKLVKIDKRGRWQQNEPQLHSGENVRDLHLLAYHEHALAYAADALHGVPAVKRHYHVLTAAVPTALIPKLVALSQRFEAEFWRTVETAADAKDEVVQVGIQIFPALHRSPKGGAK